MEVLKEEPEMTRKYGFFAVNLPEKGDWLLNNAIRTKYEATVKAVKARHKKLEESYSLSRKVTFATYDTSSDEWTEEVFSAYAAEIFRQDCAHFDELSPQQIAVSCAINWNGGPMPARPDWDGCRPLYDTRFVTTAEWELLRNIGIGGSESSVVQGTNEYCTLRGLYLRKKGVPVNEGEKSSALERGHIIEPRIYDWFCTLKGYERVPEFRMMQAWNGDNPDDPCRFVTANFDGIWHDPKTDDYGLFEAKTAAASHHADWAGDRIPMSYMSQVYQYLGILGDRRIKCAYINAFFFVNEFETGATRS